MIERIITGSIETDSIQLSGEVSKSSLGVTGDVECNEVGEHHTEYEGPYSATPSEDTQVLTTNDKLMTDDITVNPIPSQYIDISDTDATAGDVLQGKYFYIPDGTKTEGTLKIDWIGKNPYYMGQIYSISTTLHDTEYNGWTPSTTAKAIIASTSVSDTVVMDLEHYDYVLLWVSDTNVAYDNTWSASKGSPLRLTCLYTQAIFQRPSTKDNADAGVFNYNVCQQDLYAVYWVYYWSSGSALSLAYTTYGPGYISAVTAAGFSDTSSLTPTVTIKTPTISTRCSTTYFTTGNAAKVDQNNSTVKMKGFLYRVERGTSGSVQAWHYLDDVWRNPL